MRSCAYCQASEAKIDISKGPEGTMYFGTCSSCGAFAPREETPEKARKRWDSYMDWYETEGRKFFP